MSRQQLFFEPNAGVHVSPVAQLDDQISDHRVPAVCDQSDERPEVIDDHRRSQHLADAIIGYLDWRENMSIIRERRRAQALATLRRNRALRKSHEATYDVMVDVPGRS